MALRPSTILALSFLGLCRVAPADPAEFTVDRTNDETDASPGDGACASSSGGCSLRAAVQETNALPGTDRILLPAGTYVLGIPGADEDLGATGDLDIADGLTISGAGAATTVIDGGALDGVFHLPPVGFEIGVEIRGVTIRNGSAFTGGGIHNFNFNSSLTLLDVVLTGNQAQTGGAIADAISQMTLVRTTVSGNTARYEAGGIWKNLGGMTVTDSAISGNSAGLDGGGILNTGSTITLNRVTIHGNSAGGDGGGIYNEGNGFFPIEPIIGRIGVFNSTISGNAAAGNGGGIHNAFNGSLLIAGTTLSGNSATLRGGGLDIVPRREVAILGATLADNSAGEGGGIAGDSGFPGMVVVANTIVANSPDGGNCLGFDRLFSLGGNLDGDGSCNLRGPGDLSDVDALLGPLRDNGGPTLTHALLAFSPGVDRGGDSLCAQTDQRGRPRRVDGNGDGSGRCDIGAVEYQGREPDSCDLNGDGAFDSRDALAWLGGCLRGTRRWSCDVDGSGSFDIADLVGHVMSCSAVSREEAWALAERLGVGE